MGRNGSASSHHYLASEAGVEVMRAGGNAVDAAVAISAALGVVAPAMSGAAGNGYMLIFSAKDQRTYCLDFAGRAPASVGDGSPENIYFGPRAQLVPGAAAGWMAALERFGNLDPERVFAPAIRYAEQGFPVSPTLSRYIARALRELQGADSGIGRLLAPSGRAMAAGDILSMPELAQTYRRIAREGASVFYRGDIGQRIVRYLSDRSGWLTAADLASFSPEWQEPLSSTYRGWSVLTPPPPCSGLQILQTLKILEAFELGRWDVSSPEYIHAAVESIKLSRRDRVTGGSTSARAHESAWFLGDEHIGDLVRAIDPREAAPSEGDWYASPTTTHFAVGDGSGNLVSSTQTLGAIFGSGEIVDGTGLILNGLLFLFDADPRSPNRLEAGKKVDNPMSPLIARSERGATIALGSPGGQGILQTSVQMFVDIVDFGMSPQAAVEAPRFLSFGRRAFIVQFGPDHDPRSLAMEDRFPEPTTRELARRGHMIEPLGPWSNSVGAGAITSFRQPGVLEGGSDPRQDGLTSTW